MTDEQVHISSCQTCTSRGVGVGLTCSIPTSFPACQPPSPTLKSPFQVFPPPPSPFLRLLFHLCRGLSLGDRDILHLSLYSLPGWKPENGFAERIPDTSAGPPNVVLSISRSMEDKGSRHRRRSQRLCHLRGETLAGL